MKIGIIGHLKFPIAKPFAGGLESFTHAYVRALQANGHDVTLFAAGDSDPSLPLQPLVARATIPESRRRLGRIEPHWIEAIEDEAYADLMCELNDSTFDVIHNHSLSPIPLRFAGRLPTVMLTTLHAPVLPRMRQEIQDRGHQRCGRFVNISKFNAIAWRRWVPTQSIVHNGVDVDFWRSGRAVKERRAIWFGRILPDKGTHHAILGAHAAGIPIDVVGPVCDDDYFQDSVAPLLRDTDRYHGHCDHSELCDLISRSSVSVITPCWDEPFGLVVAESLACGTPVAGFARGALPEILRPDVGRLVSPGDTRGLADAIVACCGLSGQSCRDHIRQRFSFDHMVRRYEAIYATTSGRPSASIASTPIASAPPTRDGESMGTAAAAG